MAYKLLICVLPVDIVNKILEYTIANICYNTKELRIRNKFNFLEIKYIRFHNKKTVTDTRKFNYAKLCAHYSFQPNFDVPRCLFEYIYNNVIRCDKCKNHRYYCINCDFSSCEDDIILGFLE